MIHSVTDGTFVKMNSQTNDGRGALASLNLQYMGTGHISKVMLSADRTIDIIFWNGKARNFSWDGFIARLFGAFTDLEENGEPRTQEGRVQTLLRSIRDPTLAAAKAVVMATPTYRTDYQEAVNYLGGQLAAAESMTSASETRNISSMNRFERGGGGGGRGRFNDGQSIGGHFGGRGGRGGRFGGRQSGRGRGCSGGRGRSCYSASGQFLNNGFYPSEVWDGFKQDEREYITNLRSTYPSDNRERNVSATTSERGQDNDGAASQVTTPIPTPPTGHGNLNAGATMTRHGTRQ
jgi:hypothetical protein